MKVILTQSVDSLGLVGAVVNVAKGYARNYLIPQGFALEATSQNVKLMEHQKKKIEVRGLKAKEEAERIQERLAELVITISQKVGEEDRLYGSVTTMDIAEQLEEQGIAIDRRKIELDKPIKRLGEFQVRVKLHPEVAGTLRVNVVPQVNE